MEYIPLKNTRRLVNGDFPVCLPEEQGISSRSILEFLNEAERRGYELHGLEIVRNGYCVTKFAPAPLTTKYIHRVFSAAKSSVIATAVLFAVQEGKIALNDKLVDIFANRLPEYVGPLSRRITVFDLMNMATGHADNSLFYRMRQSEDWVKFFLSEEPVHIPGAVHIYNNCAPHMASCVVKQVTGQWMTEFLQPRFFEPLDIKVLCDFNWTGDLEPTTTCMSLESMAKIAQFYLQNGEWDGKQLLHPELAGLMGQRFAPQAIFPEEGRRDEPNSAGYGMFGNLFVSGIQFAGGMSNHGFIFRNEGMVVSMMANERREMELRKLFEDYILYRTYGGRLPDDGWSELLAEKVHDLNLAPKGAVESSIEGRIDGKWYACTENTLGLEKIYISFNHGEVRLRTVGLGGINEQPIGLSGHWCEGTGYIISAPDSSLSEKIRGYEPDRQYGYGKNCFYHSGAWLEPSTFVFHSRSLALACTIKFAFRFDGRRLKITANTSTLPGPVPEEKLKHIEAWEMEN